VTALILTALIAGCGGDDSGGSPEAAGSGGAPTTAAPGASIVGAAGASTTAGSGSQTTAGAAGKLPDACGFFDDATAAAAMGAPVASKAAPQAATEISSRCQWAGGQYSIGLLVQKGTAAKSSFDNLSSAFVTTDTDADANVEARVGLGARETSRRLVTYAAYRDKDKIYIYVTLQGVDRADAAATEAAATLVRATLSKLGA
jgi:hypothetical protein